MDEVFYTVVVYDNIRDRIDYEYPIVYATLAEAKTFKDSHGEDDEFSLEIAEYNIDKLTIKYVG